jgi:hypothetical protein
VANAAHNGRVPARRACALVVAALLVTAGCGGGRPAATPSPSTTTAAGPTTSGPAPVDPTGSTSSTTADTVPAGSVVVAAAGDIACEPGQAPSDQACRMQDTAALVAAAHPAAVLTLGDEQYENATLGKFRQSYDVSWGRFRNITHPSPGNHEYAAGRAPGYFAYFGAAAGPPGRGWYSFDVGGWHLIALNSNCSAVGGCGPGSPQYQWLQADLAASHARCTLAYWHHPRFSSGIHGNDTTVGPLWQALDAAGADLVLSGHDHDYERFAPLAPSGAPAAGGIREFVVGTGGRSLYPSLLPRPGSEVRRSVTFGILVLTLSPGSYRWHFAAAPGGGGFTDDGRADCH